MLVTCLIGDNFVNYIYNYNLMSMTLKTYLYSMMGSFILTLIAWVLVLLNVDPQSTGVWGIFLFYITLFLMLSSLFAIVGFYIHRKLFKDKIEFRQVEVAFRQAVLLAILLVLALFLQSHRLLTLFNTFFLVLVICGLEFLLSHKKAL